MNGRVGRRRRSGGGSRSFSEARRSMLQCLFRDFDRRSYRGGYRFRYGITHGTGKE